MKKISKPLCRSALWTIETWDKAILCIGRYYKGEKLIGLFNFSEYEKTAWIHEADGEYVDLISGEKTRPEEVRVPAFGFYYLKKADSQAKVQAHPEQKEMPKKPQVKAS